MALDTKIELFAFEVFQEFFHQNEMLSVKQDILQIYEDECLADPEYEVFIYDKRLYRALACRYALFFDIYWKKLQVDIHCFQHSISNFSYYIFHTCNSQDLFGNLTVFERLLATCVFVFILCLFCKASTSIDVVKYGYICWTMYFDKYMEEFHEQGGWIQLREVATSHESVLEFIKMCNAYLYEENYLYNYYNFKQKSKYSECKTVTKSWMKFQIEQVNNHYFSDITSSKAHFPHPETCGEIESFLQSLIKLCNPLVSKIFHSSGNSVAIVQLPKQDEVVKEIHQTYRSTETDKTSHCSEELENSPTTEILEDLTSVKPSMLESLSFEASSVDLDTKNKAPKRNLKSFKKVASSLSCNIGFEKDILLERNVSSNNGKRKFKIKKCKNINNDSHNEERRDNVDFLRMVLVLGDIQGIDYVLSTLHGNKSNSNKEKF